jgi:hypothetical protein
LDRRGISVNIPRFLESVVTRNEFVAHPDFAALYLRKGAIVFRSAGGAAVVRVNRAVTIAEVEAREKGRGAFGRLVAELVREYDVAVMVEVVLEKRFADHLLELGFDRIEGDRDTPSFVTNWADKVTTAGTELFPVIRRRRETLCH